MGGKKNLTIRAFRNEDEPAVITLWKEVLADAAPHNARYQATLAAAHIAAGEPDQAIQACEEAARLREQPHARELLLLALALAQAGDQTRARQTWAEAVAWIRESLPAHWEIQRLEKHVASELQIEIDASDESENGE